MVLIVTPSVAETEELRRKLAKLHCFVYCAMYSNMVRVAEKYLPTAVMIKVSEKSDLLDKKMKRIRSFLPDIAVITISDSSDAISELRPDLKLSPLVHDKTLQYQALYFTPQLPQSAAFWGSYIISGLLLNPTDDCKVFLGGTRVHFSPEEVFLLRYLAEIHPRRAEISELAALCFTYGKKTPRSTVASRISRINKKAKDIISVPIIQKNADEGYGFDF